MEIVGRNVIEFDIKMDEKTSFSQHELSVFFISFTFKRLKNIVEFDMDMLTIDEAETGWSDEVIKYLVRIGVLDTTTYYDIFSVKDKVAIKTIITELEDMYDELNDNYEIYKREFIIDTLL